MPLKPKRIDGCAYMTELATAAGVPASTIIYYTAVGLLQYERLPGKKARRQYRLTACLKRLREIAALQKRGRSIPAIVQHFADAGK